MERRIVTDLLEQHRRVFWEVQNIICCIPDGMWGQLWGGMPLWKHVYHTLHSLDRWFVNPGRYQEPEFHRDGLNSLDTLSGDPLSRRELERYCEGIEGKIRGYLEGLSDDQLTECPADCQWTRMTLILGQYRHLYSHLGMIMGFVIAETGKWPFVVGLEQEIPTGRYGLYQE